MNNFIKEIQIFPKLKWKIQRNNFIQEILKIYKYN
jgi:hypothetical protein